MEILEILQGEDKSAKLALFQFSIDEPNLNIIVKFNLWARYFFPQYFDKTEAPFHKMIDEYNLQCYKGQIKSFTDIAFRGAGKTVRTKLFIAYCIANNKENWRKYIKILAKDMTNSKQIVTDIYNLFVDARHREYYPAIFAKTDSKREETMASFTTSTGVKLIADTVGTEQRGQVQESFRPDLIWFEDFETRKTLRSAVETKSIWDNMEEARTGLSTNGGCIYNCNYISERGNVHRLVQKKSPTNVVLITPIIFDGVIAWNIYNQDSIGQIKQDADDFEGEYLCRPSASFDIMFDRGILEAMHKLEPMKESSGFKIFKEFDPSHRYASGHDIAGGVGLDSSTSVFIDFETFPAQVVATYKSDSIKPDIFGDEIWREMQMFGNCLGAPERNKYDQVILRLRQLGAELYKTQPRPTKINYTPPSEFGWHTNTATKPKMFFDLMKAVENGHLMLNDADLIQEAMSYSRDDLMDKEEDPRLTTRHFDLLTACAIAWQMKDFALPRTTRQRNVIQQSKPKNRAR